MDDVQALPQRRILRSLRHLSIGPHGPGNVDDEEDSSWPYWEKLPSGLAQATSLEVLDLRGCRGLSPQEADAGVLKQLKRLRRLEVTCHHWLEDFKHLRMQLPEVEVDW